MKELTIDQAEELAMQTDYAVFADDADGINPINKGDAGAFFLEGYAYAMKQHSLRLPKLTLKWQKHNRDNGRSRNEISELINEVRCAVTCIRCGTVDRDLKDGLCYGCWILTHP